MKEKAGRDLISLIENRLNRWKMGIANKMEADFNVSLIKS